MKIQEDKSGKPDVVLLFLILICTEKIYDYAVKNTGSTASNKNP